MAFLLTSEPHVGPTTWILMSLAATPHSVPKAWVICSPASFDTSSV